MKYRVMLQETASVIVEVPAESYELAENIVKEMWEDGKIKHLYSEITMKQVTEEEEI